MLSNTGMFRGLISLPCKGEMYGTSRRVFSQPERIHGKYPSTFHLLAGNHFHVNYLSLGLQKMRAF